MSCTKKLLMQNLILANTQTKFLASENHSLQFFQIMLPKATFPSEKIYFLTNLSFPLVETYFLSSVNGMFLFRAFLPPFETIIEIKKNQF